MKKTTGYPVVFCLVDATGPLGALPQYDLKWLKAL